MQILPNIDSVEFLNLTRSGAIAEAKAVRDGISRRLSNLSPAAVVAYALSRNPDQNPIAALNNIKAEAASFLGALEAAGEQVKAQVDAERVKLAAMVAAAAHRSLEINVRVQGLASIVAGIRSANASKRGKLQKAGLHGAELDAAAAPVSFDEQLAEREILLIEGEALEAFLKSRDVRHLPEGFAAEIREAA